MASSSPTLPSLDSMTSIALSEPLLRSNNMSLNVTVQAPTDLSSFPETQFLLLATVSSERGREEVLRGTVPLISGLQSLTYPMNVPVDSKRISLLTRTKIVSDIIPASLEPHNGVSFRSSFNCDQGTDLYLLINVDSLPREAGDRWVTIRQYLQTEV